MEKRPLDRISLLGLAFFGYHGAYPPERQLGQRFEVDLEMALDCRPAGRSDDLNQALDYSAVYSRARQVVEGEPVNLLETLAERLAQKVLALPRVEQVVVRVRKPAAPLPGVFRTVQVEVTRSREDLA
ncbi:MAG: dihydroneopterin aldolase [Bacillota bacterium]